jgi:hypothetical protein
MKVVARPITVYSWTDAKGVIHPEKLKLEENDAIKELNIDKVVTITKEKLAGNQMLIFNCQSLIRGVVRPYELKYELNTCKWMLFKI